MAAPTILLPRRRLSSIVHRDVYRRMCAVRDLIHAHYEEALTVDDLAAQAAMSPFHFGRQFRRVFGETPNQYLARVRIEEAKRLLGVERRSVTEACVAVGFTSLGSFSSRFRRDVGLSPSAYRKAMVTLVRVPRDLPRIVIPWCFLDRFGPR